MKNTSGSTLIGLLYTVALAAIILSVGVPSFQQTLRNSEMTATTNGLLSAMHVARSEAIKRRARVTLCPSDNADPPSCDTNGTGLTIFVNAADDQTIDLPADTIIQTRDWLRGGVDIGGDGGIPGYVTYAPSGFTRAIGGGSIAGSLLFCDTRGEDAARVLTLSPTGRPQIRHHGEVVDAPACPEA